MSIDGRAEECAKHILNAKERFMYKMGYMIGVTDRRKINIKKACEWLNENFNQVLLKGGNGEVVESFFTCEIEEQFRQAMEE